ncbi:MAG: ArgE/DapE family deacylase [Eubacteriales bacterium]|nr:ArgE/DapE family deacylase [Eubacteriales bacterium]
MPDDEGALCTLFLQDLIALDTANPPGNERIAAEYVARRLGEYGIACEVTPVAEGRSNVVTAPMGEGLAVLLSGHLDVVPTGEGWNSDPFQPVCQDGRIYGRGACDMKGGVAAMMAAAVWAKRHEAEAVPFRLAFTVDEELYGLGTRTLLTTLPPQSVRYCILGEPTGNELHIAHRGAIRFRVKIEGRSCHAGNPGMGVNALEYMARVIDAVQAVNRTLGREHRHSVLPPASMCCTTIRAGTKDNIVPDTCEMTIDCRPLPGDTAEAFQKAILTQLGTISGSHNEVRLTMTPYINMPPGGVAEDSGIVRWARANFRSAFGQEPKVDGFPACCDLAYFTGAGIPALLYGPGFIAQAHTANEFVDIRQLEQAYAFYRSCLTRRVCADEPTQRNAEVPVQANPKG